MTDAVTVRCDTCKAALLAVGGGRLKHNPNGTHTFVPPTAPRAMTDPKPRGRRRG